MIRNGNAVLDSLLLPHWPAWTVMISLYLNVRHEAFDPKRRVVYLGIITASSTFMMLVLRMRSIKAWETRFVGLFRFESRFGTLVHQA